MVSEAERQIIDKFIGNFYIASDKQYDQQRLPLSSRSNRCSSNFDSNLVGRSRLANMDHRVGHQPRLIERNVGSSLYDHRTGRSKSSNAVVSRYNRQDSIDGCSENDYLSSLSNDTQDYVGHCYSGQRKSPIRSQNDDSRCYSDRHFKSCHKQEPIRSRFYDDQNQTFDSYDYRFGNNLSSDLFDRKSKKSTKFSSMRSIKKLVSKFTNRKKKVNVAGDSMIHRQISSPEHNGYVQASSEPHLDNQYVVDKHRMMNHYESNTLPAASSSSSLLYGDCQTKSINTDNSDRTMTSNVVSNVNQQPTRYVKSSIQPLINLNSAQTPHTTRDSTTITTFGHQGENNQKLVTTDDHSGPLYIKNYNKPPPSSASPRSTSDIVTGPSSSSSANTYSACSGDSLFTPGLMGIANHGNTCYINAVIQCLSNNDILAEYFLTNNHLPHLQMGQKNAEKYGSQGYLTKRLAEFIESLWFKRYTPEISIKFKETVEKYSEQYKGSLQQDSQEFFIWLLDRVHEDLNVGVKKRYRLNKTRDKSDNEIALSTMTKHLEEHYSFISSNFHGLFISSVTCPVCGKQSSQSDPFACVSLPVSQSSKKPLYVIMVLQQLHEPQFIRFGLNADITATFLEVKQCLAKVVKIPVERLILCNLSSNGFGESYADLNDIAELSSIKCIYAFETPHLFDKRSGEETLCLVCNQVGQATAGKKIGAPVVIKVYRDVSFVELRRTILESLGNQLILRNLIQDIPRNAFRLRIVDDYHPLSYVPEDVPLPLYSSPVENYLMNQRKSSGPMHIKIMVEWNDESYKKFFDNFEEPVTDHQSARDLEQQETLQSIQTLNECLYDFTQDEWLQWYCPDCRKHQEKAFKRTAFFYLPNVLTLHLKRNKQLPSGQMIKLEPLVKFPVNELDLTPFIHRSSPLVRRRASNNSTNDLYRDSRSITDYDDVSGNLYDLFAVCNHHGDSPNSGHYTAYCRNPVNGQWYCFDDQSVTKVNENRLVTSSAYMLFYEKRQRRNLVSTNFYSSSESGFIDHWFFKICASKSLKTDPNNGISSSLMTTDNGKRREYELTTTTTTTTGDVTSKTAPPNQNFRQDLASQNPSADRPVSQMFVDLPSEMRKDNEKCLVGRMISIEDHQQQQQQQNERFNKESNNKKSNVNHVINDSGDLSCDLSNDVQSHLNIWIESKNYTQNNNNNNKGYGKDLKPFSSSSSSSSSTVRNKFLPRSDWYKTGSLVETDL